MRACALSSLIAFSLALTDARAEVVNLAVAPGSTISAQFFVYFESTFLGGTDVEVTPVSGNINLGINRDGNGNPSTLVFGFPTQFFSQRLDFVVDFSGTPIGNLGTAQAFLNPAVLSLSSSFPLALSPSGPDTFAGSLEGQFGSIDGQTSNAGAIGPATPGSFLDFALRIANPDDGIYNFSLSERVDLVPGPYGAGTGTISVIDGLSQARGASITIDALLYDVVPIGGDLPFRIDVAVSANIVAVPESHPFILLSFTVLGFAMVVVSRSVTRRQVT